MAEGARLPQEYAGGNCEIRALHELRKQALRKLVVSVASPIISMKLKAHWLRRPHWWRRFAAMKVTVRVHTSDGRTRNVGPNWVLPRDSIEISDNEGVKVEVFTE